MNHMHEKFLEIFPFVPHYQEIFTEVKCLRRILIFFIPKIKKSCVSITIISKVDYIFSFW